MQKKPIKTRFQKKTTKRFPKPVTTTLAQTPPKKRATIRPSRLTKQEPESNTKVTWKAGTMLYPLPAVMVSCGDKEAEYNIITIAWTGITCSDPPQCYISIQPKRHSYGIIKRTREFCINLTTVDLAYATDWCGVKSGKDVDKFKEMNLTAIPGKVTKAPMIAESPLNLECKVQRIINLGSHDMFMAKIVAIHASEKYVNPKTNALNLAKTPLVSYSHGKYYEMGPYMGKFGFSVEKRKKKKKTPLRK